MKTLLKRYVCLWLSLTVLLGSVGLTVSEHICLISGKAMLSYEQKEDPCCKNKKPETAAATHKDEVKAKCCTFKIDQHKLELAANIKFKQISFVWIAAPLNFNPAFFSISSKREQVFQYTNTSPPLYGKLLLYSLHTLRV